MRVDPIADRSTSFEAGYEAVTAQGLGASVLVVDGEPATRSFLQGALARRFALVETVADTQAAEALWQRCHFDLLIADIRLSGRSGVDWVQVLRERGSTADVIFLAANADLDQAIGALRLGAADLILKPFRIEQLLAAVERCIDRRKLAREMPVLRPDPDPIPAIEGMVVSCVAMRDLCQVIERVAPMRSTVLIEGESGTGKELAARAIHARSGRKGGFVAINCGSISPELLESELFGHAKGAFTGAHQSREGLFAYAEGGTLFLDEIGEMPLAMQAKLLRVLEDRSVRPVGVNQESPVDVRVVAASNRNLRELMEAGHFRKDLFYRLNVMVLRLPPLRERIDDVPLLARHFLDLLAREMELRSVPCDPTELDRLTHYDWPGNVRELRNVIERCLLLGLPPSQCISPASGLTGKNVREADPDLSLESVERRHIRYVLRGADGNKSEAARRLGISRKTLERKLRTWAAEL